MPWERLVIVAVVVAASFLVAKLIDRRMARRELAPEAVTRYRVVRRSITSAVVAVGVLSALLVIPQVQAVATGILASSAVIGLVVGLAAQRTIGNFIAGLLIAFTQPLRLGDRVEVAGAEGVVEEIGLTYTFIRTPDEARVVIPNEKLASDTIRNSTIVSREKLAEITLQVPRDKDLSSAVDLLRAEFAEEPRVEVLVTDLADAATVTLRAWAPDEADAQRLESDLRLRAHSRLLKAGYYT